MKLPLSLLELARSSPKEVKQQMVTPRTWYPKPGYFGYLKYAIYRFHKYGLTNAKLFLEEKLDDKFKNNKRIAQTIEDFEWYIDEYEKKVKQNWISIETQTNFMVPIPPSINQDFRCTGRIDRLDMVPTGGYSAWVFRQNEPDGWFNELRMPLIQLAIGHMLDIQPNQLYVGIYSFEERFVQAKTFTSDELKASFMEFANVIRSLESTNP